MCNNVDGVNVHKYKYFSVYTLFMEVYTLIIIVLSFVDISVVSISIQSIRVLGTLQSVWSFAISQFAGYPSPVRPGYYCDE